MSFSRTVAVSYSTIEGFQLHVVQPSWRKVFVPLGSFLMQPLGSLWIPVVSPVLYGIGQKLILWEDDHEEDIVSIPIDRAVAEQLAHSEDDWAWVDD